MTNKQKFLLLERCSELFQTKRMGHINGPIEPSNSIMGLYELIQKYFNEDFKMAEIGSFHGTSTRFFSLFVDTIYSIDIYDYHVPLSGRIAEMDKMFKEAEEIFLERTKDYNNIVKIKKNSVDAAKEFEDNSINEIELYKIVSSSFIKVNNGIDNFLQLCGCISSIYLYMSQNHCS